MLKKLYKHEFYSLFRSMLGIYTGIIGLAVLSKLSWLINDNNLLGSILQTSTTVFYVLGVIAMFVIGFAIVIVRFFKNLLSKEGYLTFTLPFKPVQHINCKLICGCAVIAVNAVVFLLSLLIFFIGTDSFNTLIENIKMGYEMMVQVYKPWQIALVFTEFIFILLISLVNSLITPYAAMSIGQRFRSKIGGSVLAYLCIYGAIETIDMIFLIILSVFFSNGLSEMFTNDGFELMVLVYGVSAVWSSIISAVLYIITRKQLTNHLNLE